MTQPVITQSALTLKSEGCPVFDGNIYNYQKWRAQVKAVFKTGHIPNARMHAQILNHLSGEPKTLAETIEMDDSTSAWKLMDLLDGDYNKPWLACKLLIEQLFQLKSPEYNLKTSEQVLQSRRYVMHLRKIQSAAIHLPDANAALQTLLDKVMLNLPIKLLLKWEDRCEDTARTKHSHLYIGCSKDYTRQNQKFQTERLEDLINVLDSHMAKSKSIIDRVGKDGYLNPVNMAQSAAEAMDYEKNRVKNMQHVGNPRPQAGNNPQPKPQNQQSKGKGKGRLQSYNTEQVNQTGSSGKPQQQQQPRQQQQSQPKQKNSQGSAGVKGPPPGQPQVWDKECFICGQKNQHWPSQCTNPTNRSATSMLKSCIKARACYNCLRTNAGHVANACTFGKCQVSGCMDKHHTLLHGADFSKIRELQQEVNEKREKQEQAKAAKLEAKATQGEGQSQATHSAQGKQKKGKKGGRNGNKGQAPNPPTQQQHSTTEVQPEGTVAKVTFAKDTK